jgi:hypothetical protein
MKTSMGKRCGATKPDGSNCRTAALPGSVFCLFHDPSRADERREAKARGGRQNHLRTLQASVPDVRVKDRADAIALLSETINQVRKGQIDPKVANCVGFLANILMKAIEGAQVDARIEQLETTVKGHTSEVDLALTGDSYDELMGQQ